MLRMLHNPNEPAPSGWTKTVTPLGASAHVRTNSAAHELCEDWRILINGRAHFVQPHNFVHWFGPLCLEAPPGLSAELLMSNNLVTAFTELLQSYSTARAHILSLPDHCFDMDADEWQLLGEAMDIARTIEARIAARAAAQEAFRDD